MHAAGEGDVQVSWVALSLHVVKNAPFLKDPLCEQCVMRACPRLWNSSCREKRLWMLGTSASVPL